MHDKPEKHGGQQTGEAWPPSGPDRAASRRRIFLFLPWAVLLLPLLAGRPARAHIESGPMPDPMAAMEYRILLEFEPEDTVSRNRLAMILVRQGKLEEAEAELAEVLRRAPGDFDALDTMGLIRTRQERIGEGLEFFRKAVAAKPDDVLVYLHFGRALEAGGALAEAEEAYRTGLEKAGGPAAAGGQSENAAALAQALREVRARSAKRPEGAGEHEK